MTQCPHCKRTIGFKKPTDLCGTCEARNSNMQPHIVKHSVTYDEAGAVVKVEAIMSDATAVTVVEVTSSPAPAPECSPTLTECPRCTTGGPLAHPECKLWAGTQAPAPAPGGYKLVPLEPTPEMLATVRNGPAHETWAAGYRAMLAAAPTAPCAAVGERIAGPLAPHPIADIICAWANGFRVEFRYHHHNPGIPEEIYLSDERWHLCGKAYSAWSGINEHRIHADDLAAWEAFKRAPATPAAEEDHDAWQCDRCNGDGWHWVEHEGVEWRDKVSTKEHCEQCDGLGWLGPDATKAAAAKKGKPPVQNTEK